MEAKEAKNLLSAKGDVTVVKGFKRFAMKEQKDLVKYKKRLFDKDRIIVLFGKRVIDGNHHLVAAVQLNKPINYIDLDLD